MEQSLLKFGKTISWLLLLLSFPAGIKAQSLLNKTINISVNRQSVPDVLELISNQANFYFSYNSNIIKKDSLVSIPEGNRTVRSVLEQLFPSGFEFKESGNYLIIRRAPLKLTLVTEQSESNDNYYQVSGYVRDDQTGEKITDASVYEKQRLASAITNGNGYFKLKLKSRYKTAALSVSKEFYEDTTVNIQSGYNQEITITLSPATINSATIIVGPGTRIAPDSIYISIPQPDSTDLIYLYKKMDSIRVQRTAMGKFLLSSRLKLQSVNLGKFFTVRPVQFSLTPGLSTNGKLNSQVVNNFSFNVFGGYSGGINGFELAGLFNLDKKSVQYFQIGGLFNMVGGKMTGIQIGGLNNTVLDSVKGFQLGGLYNHVSGNTRGVQLAGLVNFTRRKTRGWQFAGIGNISAEKINGVQMAGIFNYTKKLNGLQFGLINIADSSDGYSIGLINIIFKGYHKLALYSNEVTAFNAAFKTGNHKLYSILLAGASSGQQKSFAFGYGLGNSTSFNNTFGMNAELSSQYLYLGSWEHINLLNRASLNLEIKFGKYLAIYAGPAFNGFYSNQLEGTTGYQFPIPPTRYKTINLGEQWTGWFGWNAGIHIF
ncbi:STN and carboxypeptidase regulatory-like domain-containing protein [Flavihumibacter fluvii]|uniref:STN and carboxypeptidase regulatory-like domain-containing protein n=1 Tax=Flavihumibacter fluvii TaxID=2838157 RepID=UPI001BDEE7F9|nr:STN and carboxypeptidase regulatory-like domain-containing protein [Flavihumibacter fluvii]ULQ53553.1 carboxypeptidase-like regulatory domain-containing protein [Flavihumibacter fluvii]